jgi:tetratricopeptide (TPR) repeat protein
MEKQGCTFFLQALKYICKFNNSSVYRSRLMAVLNLDKFYSGLDRLFEGYNPGEVQEYLEKNLAEADASGDIKGATAVLNELSGLYRVQGRFSDAIEASNRSLYNLRQMGQKDTENYATALINLADIYVADKRYREALDMFKSSENILISLGLQEDYRMAALYNNISSVYRALGDRYMALETAQKAMNIIEHHDFGADVETDIATTCINLGEAQISCGILDEAERNLRRACEIYARRTDNRDGHYPAALYALARLEFKRGNLGTAEKYIEEAMCLVEKVAGRGTYYRTLQSALESIRERRDDR